ncbi:leukocyte immunoglobulin-like receptor subfamily A member 2 isoform X3 [Lepidochelys kempii]|uniref:leukocyte immunoglobulin-like receptor subfamily A member 2 isoform X3 n=1 Tax=Lepidochelys kempii TaxID=8472 RepID=UPI003C6EE075
MAFAFTVLFLGCWLAGRSGTSGGMGTTQGEFACTQSSAPQEIQSEGTSHPAAPPNCARGAGGSPGERISQSSARRKHGGSYICRYSHRTGPTRYSEPSDPVQIIVADPSLPRPSISLSPTGVTAPGADVTIRCQGQRRDVRFFLHKAGDLNPPRHMDPAGDGAEFRIPTVGRQHGGSYGCSYRPRSEPFVSSQPSHPVQLVVADPTLPKPSVSVCPSRGFATQEPVAMSYPSDPSLLGVRDYTGGNIVRLALSAGVLLALALILAKAAHSWRRGGR